MKGGEILARLKREDGKNARTVASNKYQKNNYDRINLLLPKGNREKLRNIAASYGCSLNAYITQAIKEKIERDNENNIDKSD